METIELLKSVLNALGVNMRRTDDLYQGMMEFDGGIRAQLFENYEMNWFTEQFRNTCQDQTAYVSMDYFGLNYILFRYETEYVVIGPYRLGEPEKTVVDLVKELQIPLFHVSTLTTYLYGIPVLPELESIVFVFLGNMFGEEHFRIQRMSTPLDENIEKQKPRLEDDKKLSMELVEKRYQIEEKLLAAIEQGDVTKANLAMAELGGAGIEQRAETLFREQKNFCLISNVLYRKAVQRAKVHPAHIDELSNQFVKRIEYATRQLDLSKINQDMIRKYCLLVQNYSMKGYSETMEKILNYVDFHIEEPLTLKMVAEKFNLNASYLSRLFKKELGRTMTDYINEERVEKSLMYLTTTALPIQEVAARVGIMDENYFSRIFKKMKNMTPREYRNLVKRGMAV